ncbi:MAG: hypothetical protein ACRDKF_16465 [Actinomycetota bacterium]
MPAISTRQSRIVAVVLALTTAVAAAVLFQVTRPEPESDRGSGRDSRRPQAPRSAGFVRGVYGHDSSGAGLKQVSSVGFDTVTVTPDVARLNQLEEKGLRGVVWLGAYDSTKCTFERDDRWIRDAVQRIAGHRAILVYQITDEPNHNTCPQAPRQITERAELVESLDPGVPTYVTVPAWDGKEGFPYRHFAQTTDIMGLVVYPCLNKSKECWFKMIDRAIAEASSANIKRYWAVVQNFQTEWYRLPTSGELEEQFDRWSRSRMSGYFVYQWSPEQTASDDERMQAFERLNESPLRS